MIEEVSRKPAKNKTQIIALGGAGCNTAKYLYEKGIVGSYCCLTNAQRTDLPESFLFLEHHIYSKEKHLHLTIKNNIWDNETVKPDLDATIQHQLEELFNTDSKFILIAGLGGLTGSYWVKRIANELKEKNKEFGTISIIPFGFEESRTEYAKVLKDELATLPNLYFISNELIKEKHGNVSMSKAFEMGNEEVWNICKEIIKD